MIQIKSPTRVDLAGGTLDLWPLYNFIATEKGYARTINVAISIYTGADLTPRTDSKIELDAVDMKFHRVYENLDECLRDTDARVSLLQAQVRFWKPSQGFTLRTYSESPVGGGLGGSSSLTISMMKAFSIFAKQSNATALNSSSVMNTNYDNHKMVEIAHNIESRVLNTPTGTQDYYPAISGGVNILTYKAEGVHQLVLPVSSSVIAEKFMLIYTGRSHHSGLNNFEVLTNAVSKKSVTLAALEELAQISDETVEAVQNQKWNQMGDLFRREYSARIKLAPAFSSPEIERLQQLTLQNGAEAVKICGAGGGGCVMVWVDPSARQKVAEACQKEGFQVLNAQPVNPL